MRFFSAVLLLAVLGVCNAFKAPRTFTQVNTNLKMALSLATIGDTFQFRKPKRLSFSTLYKELAAVGLDATVRSDGPFTVFAPTDAAFAKIPEGTLEALLADKDKLTKILTYHVVSEKIAGEGIRDQNGKKFITVNGALLTVNDDIYVENGKINCFDIECSNGYIHAIDQVLIPE